MKIKVGVIICSIIVLLSTVLIVTKCSSKTESPSDSSSSENSALMPQPHGESLSDEVVQTNYGNVPKVEVTKSITYLFNELENNELYVACEYKNTSDCPCIITAVNYELNISEKKVEVQSTQPASKFCIIYPDETMYHAAWQSYACTDSDSAEIVNITIDCEKCTDDRLLIKTDNLYLVQNYPDFSSVSGILHGTDDNAMLNEIYLAFYDSNDSLLGVWYFTEPSEIVANQDKHFTTHLRALPLKNLTETATRVEAVGFGFN